MVRASRILALIAFAFACATPEPAVNAPEPRMPGQLSVRGVVEFFGACDASGAVPLDAKLFAVADDEDNLIRIYDAERGGAPISSMDLSKWLIEGEEEADLEAAARIEDRALWLASHSRNKKGKLKPSRIVFVATELPKPDEASVVVGEPYRGLLDALIADSRFAPFHLEHAATLPPKTPGGLNVEGMTRTQGGGVLIGLRNPTPGGRALLFEIANAVAVAEGRATPELGDPILLDLGGRGVRGLSSWQGEYLIAAGASEAGASDALFAWPGPGSVARPVDLDLSDFNPEGFFSPRGATEIMLLSDDGEAVIEGRACKKLKDANLKRFRGLWIH